jgi:hypothetical protein
MGKTPILFDDWEQALKKNIPVTLHQAYREEF